MAFFKLHPDDEVFDDIRLVTVSRWKESGYSGSEWRVSTDLELWRKGKLIYKRGYLSMAAAMAHLPWLLQGGLPDEIVDDDVAWRAMKNEDVCYQPGCAAAPECYFELKQEFSKEGDLIDHEGSDVKLLRAFCREHSIRGDCGREDSEQNYVEVNRCDVFTPEGKRR